MLSTLRCNVRGIWKVMGSSRGEEALDLGRWDATLKEGCEFRDAEYFGAGERVGDTEMGGREEQRVISKQWGKVAGFELRDRGCVGCQVSGVSGLVSSPLTPET